MSTQSNTTIVGGRSKIAGCGRRMPVEAVSVATLSWCWSMASSRRTEYLLARGASKPQWVLWEREYNEDRNRWAAAVPAAALVDDLDHGQPAAMEAVGERLLRTTLHNEILSFELSAFQEVTDDGLMDENGLWSMAYDLWPEEMKELEI